MRAILSAPTKTITGAFNIRVTCARAIESLDASHVHIHTLIGDTLGADYAVRGKDRQWSIVCPMPDARVGVSEVSLRGSVSVDGIPVTLDAKPVRITYDTRRIVRAVLSAPTKTVIGGFNTRITFQRAVHSVETANVRFQTTEGDAIGESYRIQGRGLNWYIAHKLPEFCVGSSEIALTGSVIANGAMETIDAKPVTVRYDTHRSLPVSWGDVRYEKGHIALPMTFDAPLSGLTQKHFRLIAVSGHLVSRLNCYLYGQDAEYELVFIPNNYRRGVFTIEMARQVQKATGVFVDVEMPPLEIRYPEGN